jgi:hypothetical protein
VVQVRNERKKKKKDFVGFEITKHVDIAIKVKENNR